MKYIDKAAQDYFTIPVSEVSVKIIDSGRDMIDLRRVSLSLEAMRQASFIVR
jgi:hypothetical protein